MPARHSRASLGFVAAIPFSIVIEITGLGPVRFCHGSPRSDTEVVTPATPGERFAELCAGVDEQVLVTGHTHLQFDRRVAGRRSVNPGSVGLPYHEGEPGTAYWALLGPDVTLRQTRYDVTAAVAAAAGSGDPAAEKIEGLLLSPPSPGQITAEAEQLVFSDYRYPAYEADRTAAVATARSRSRSAAPAARSVCASTIRRPAPGQRLAQVFRQIEALIGQAERGR